ncbi:MULTISPECIES: Zn-ribbon domain-containing OB-fold protein [Hydrocarboniphaga]|jgi:uncharacterized OB-fold protein|uniref:DUF35 domain-containing protein n=1 Tax=Hydrocarboniphaga effusa AP103 TaxID=1172194 RepID=I8TAA8_9GAMM|nr:MULTISPECIES: OB-fold domain-containing protein [Hydrocarboniphaga]EIT70833.1 hypothetical protein WQQ_09700 [Hydrocarboniphaga effusa AP103]MDZ4078928.1 zinc ribbon domain-containing protein [Hydrocarboniphaga sp.]
MSEITDEQLLERYPGVRIEHDNKAFYRGLLNRTLLMDRCGDCAHWFHPPRPICPKCWSRNIQPTAVKGSGTIHLLIFLHQGPPAPGVSYDTPHPVATVELDEQPGLRFTSTIVGTPNEELAIGQRVRLGWVDRRTGADPKPVPVFERVDS